MFHAYLRVWIVKNLGGVSGETLLQHQLCHWEGMEELCLEQSSLPGKKE